MPENQQIGQPLENERLRDAKDVPTFAPLNMICDEQI